VLSAWRYVIRSRDPRVLPRVFLVGGGLLAVLILAQMVLGSSLVWTYGLHTVPVVEAMREGRL
jgi:uncharacterized membrane protein